MIFDIDKYGGYWKNQANKALCISIVDKSSALVSLYTGDDLQPIRRPWFENRPSIDMVAKYSDHEGSELIVELWKPGSGYCFHLHHEYDLVIDSKRQEALAPGISRYEDDAFLDDYYSVIGPLIYYVRSD